MAFPAHRRADAVGDSMYSAACGCRSRREVLLGASGRTRSTGASACSTRATCTSRHRRARDQEIVRPCCAEGQRAAEKWVGKEEAHRLVLERPQAILDNAAPGRGGADSGAQGTGSGCEGGRIVETAGAATQAASPAPHPVHEPLDAHDGLPAARQQRVAVSASNAPPPFRSARHWRMHNHGWREEPT